MLGSDSEAGTPNLRQHGRFGRSERNFLVLCVTMAAIVLLVGNGGSTLSHIVASAKGVGIGPDRLLPTALLLNIALIVFGWVRYDDLGHEVGERRHAEQQARWLAETDPLTGCLNRRSIGPATEALIAAAAARGEVAGFIMVDLDRFKQINDLNGHAVGDRLLCECARRIRSLLPPGSLVARLGGDEFACVVAFNPHQREAIDHLAASLVRGMSAPVIVEGYEGEVTASLGLTRSDANSNGATHGSAAIAYDELLNMADIAMYQAKKQGRNQHKWFEASMAAELRYRSDLENAIRLGIANAEFVPYYEQQIDLLKGDLVGFEMLARWQSPTLGIVGPEVFIPVAEDMGVIAELSESLIRQALQDARGWHPRLTLSVNISPVQLRDPWFAQKILKLLVAANFPPTRLDIEITESCLHQNIAGVLVLITSLKNQGVQISLDDFGTGYSSMAQLRDLPFDRIKIDRSFITTMDTDQNSAAIVQIISALADRFGLPITAEGIETPEILEKLSALGQFKGQGYLYGKPAPAQEITALLAGCKLLATDAGAAPQISDTGGKASGHRLPGAKPRSKKTASAAETIERRIA